MDEVIPLRLHRHASLFNRLLANKHRPASLGKFCNCFYSTVIGIVCGNSAPGLSPALTALPLAHAVQLPEKCKVRGGIKSQGQRPSCSSDKLSTDLGRKCHVGATRVDSQG